MFRICFYVSLLIFVLGCQKQEVVLLNEEEHCFEINNEGEIISQAVGVNTGLVIQDTLQSTRITFQSNRLVINLKNGTSIIFKPNENVCNEWEQESSMDSCQEEYFLAAICKDEENSSIICSNDSVFWEFNIQLTQNKEGVDSAQFKIKKFKNQKKSLQGKMVLENTEKKPIF
ncbi:MAG: hypothetical protein KatS3mg035_1988 [Bacteroidia bacterium]|nr:MAG: hypothetical protein KatS3mg035_1988 [Bacteroidia bacterium]